jgi:hypothetical protein
MGFIVQGDNGYKVDATINKEMRVALGNDAVTMGGAIVNGGNDYGEITGQVEVRTIEVDSDYRTRVSSDLVLDEVVFNHGAQNTGKTYFGNTTMAATWVAGTFTTNSSSIVTTTTGLLYQSRAYFPVVGTQTLSFDYEVGFSAQPQANSIIDFGGFINSLANPYTPTDGVFFRLSSAGLEGIASFNGTEASTGIFPAANGAGTWTYVNDKRYQFIVYIGGVEAVFWVNNGTDTYKLGSIKLPVGQGRLCMAGGLPWAVRHVIVGGAAGGVLQAKFTSVNVRLGGSNLTTLPSTQGNRIYGSYQGMDGGTMGQLASYTNSSNPTAAAPSNTALTANLPNGLGGQGLVTAAAAAATDGIWASYQVPQGGVTQPGRRLVLRGVMLDAVNLGAAVATTATTVQFCLAFGHTNVSLATGDAATTKSPRRVPMGFMSWPIGAAIGQGPQNGRLFLDLGDAPAFVNPGEFVQIVGKFVAGTATASQTIQVTWTPIYGWE